MRIGIDMDGVIDNWVGGASETIKKNFGLELTLEDWSTARTIDLLKSKLPEIEQLSKEEIYSKICPPGFFRNLNPYDGAIETVKELSKIADIVFVTKPLDFVYSTKEKADWLKEYFNDINYDLVFVADGKTKGLVNVDYMIDDDPYVIENCKESIPLLVRQPWNLSFREKESKKLIGHYPFLSIYNIQQAIETINLIEYIKKFILKDNVSNSSKSISPLTLFGL